MQTVERPRFRQDLVAEPIEDGNARFIDVADPDSGHMFRFYEVEYSLACAMDGERDIAGIVKWAEEELGLKPSANEVRSVISTLGELGYLESGKAAAAAATEPAAAAVHAAPVETPRPAEPPSRPTPPPNRKTPPAGVPKAAEAKKQPEKQPEKPQPEAFNRWDQPTAMGDPDEYLERGVHAGNQHPNTPAPDVELGHAGGRVAARGDDLPASDDMELGAPGVKAAQAVRSTGRDNVDVQLGASGAAGVSTDLAADMAISPADVKAAVRASQVMKAADVPADLAAELEPEAKQAAKVETKPAEKKPTEKKPEPRVPDAKLPEKKPVPMPTERPVLPQAPPARGVNPILWVVLVLVILGAGGFALWKFVLNKKSDTSAQVTPTPTPTPTPAPPPVETAMLATETVPSEEIKPAGAAQIATLIASDSEVKEGDTIAKLVGFKPHFDKVAMYEKEIPAYTSQIEAAEKAIEAAPSDAAKKAPETKIIGLKKMIADREAKLAASRTELDKYLIKSPGAGKVTIVAKVNAKVTPTDIVATLQREAVLVVTFKSAPDATADAKVLLAVKGGDQKLSCAVVATGGDGTKIACPGDAAPEGTEVSYAGLEPVEAPAEDGAEGSAAAPAEGSAEPAEGSAEPAEGSAEPAADDTAEPAAPVAPKAAPRPRPRPVRPRPAPAAPAPVEKPAGEKLFPPGSGAEPAPPATPPPSGGTLQ